MSSQTIKIRLSELIPFGTTALTSRPLGISVRNKSGIDAHATQKQAIKVIIPKEITSMTPSFLGEFLEHAIHVYGQDFKKLVEFESEGRYKVELDLEMVFHSIKRRRRQIQREVVY